MRMRKLGRTGVSVTELGLGTAPLGDLFDRIEDDEASAIVSAAWDGGVRYFDTSPVVRTRAVGTPPRPGSLPQGPRRLRHFDEDRASAAPPAQNRPHQGSVDRRPQFRDGVRLRLRRVMRSFEDSLQRLGISSIDLLLVHDLDIWNHKNPGQARRVLRSAHHRRLARARRAAGLRRDQGRRRRSECDGDDSPVSRSLRHRFFPPRHALHAARAGRARRRVPALRRARRRDCRRRRLQFRDSGDRRGSGRHVQLRACGTSDPRPRGEESRPSASAGTFRWRRRRCSSRSAIRSSPRSFRGRSRRSKSSRTSPPSATKSPPISGRSSRAEN